MFLSLPIVNPRSQRPLYPTASRYLHQSRKAQISGARSEERAFLTIQGYRTQVRLSADGSCSGRTGHPFAASSSEELLQKIESVFSASPETIRGEPRECDLLCSVGKRRDLAACAWIILFS